MRSPWNEEREVADRKSLESDLYRLMPGLTDDQIAFLLATAKSYSTDRTEHDIRERFRHLTGQ